MACDRLVTLQISKLQQLQHYSNIVFLIEQKLQKVLNQNYSNYKIYATLHQLHYNNIAFLIEPKLQQLQDFQQHYSSSNITVTMPFLLN